MGKGSIRVLELAAAALLLCRAAAEGGAAAPADTVRVPVAPPRIVVVEPGKAEPVWQEPPVRPADEIQLTGFASGLPPEDLLAGMERLRTALPDDYLEALMAAFGYEKTRARTASASRRGDLRERDLAVFLFTHWVEAAPQSQLAREFDCLSWGEYDITVFLSLLTYQEFLAGRHASLWRVLPALKGRRVPRAAGSSARQALFVCKDLIEAKSGAGRGTEP